jgi:hypothetical protein
MLATMTADGEAFERDTTGRETAGNGSGPGLGQAVVSLFRAGGIGVAAHRYVPARGRVIQVATQLP